MGFRIFMWYRVYSQASVIFKSLFLSINLNLPTLYHKYYVIEIFLKMQKKTLLITLEKKKHLNILFIKIIIYLHILFRKIIGLSWSGRGKRRILWLSWRVRGREKILWALFLHIYLCKAFGFNWIYLRKKEKIKF